MLMESNFSTFPFILGVSPITESEEDHLSNLSRRNSMDIRANLTPLKLLPARKALQNYGIV